VLFLVTSDPRETHRPAEAIRVAAGLGAWKKADVRVYLRGPAIRALGEWVDDLKMEDDFTRYLPIIRDWGRPVWVQSGAPEISDLGEATVPFEEISDLELANRCSQATSVLRF
jgi:hypothetical protein